MTKHTSRDEVWNHALRYALLEESFNISHVEDELTERASQRTIRDTLNTMVDHGWLIKDAPQAHEWHPGPKAVDIQEFEESFNQSSPTATDVEIYSGVEDISEQYADRVSNSGNLVIEEDGGSHVLGSHGPVEEYVKIPHKGGKPVQVALPRMQQDRRVLVCREQSIVRGDDGIQFVKQPQLLPNDIVPVRFPLVIQTGDTQEMVGPEELDGIPLPLFANADTLQLPNAVKLTSEKQYAVEIDSINNGIASGTVYERSNLRTSSNSSSSSNESLDGIAERVGTVTDSANTTAVGRLNSDWDDRKREVLTDVANTYD